MLNTRVLQGFTLCDTYEKVIDVLNDIDNGNIIELDESQIQNMKQIIHYCCIQGRPDELEIDVLRRIFAIGDMIPFSTEELLKLTNLFVINRYRDLYDDALVHFWDIIRNHSETISNELDFYSLKSLIRRNNIRGNFNIDPFDRKANFDDIKRFYILCLCHRFFNPPLIKFITIVYGKFSIQAFKYAFCEISGYTPNDFIVENVENIDSDLLNQFGFYNIPF